MRLAQAFTIVLALIVLRPAYAGASVPPLEKVKPVPLFNKGPETFTLKDEKGETPEFHLLTDTPNKRALAAAIVGALNADPETQPKLPQKQELDVKVKSMTFTPHPSNSAYLQVRLQLTPKITDEVTLPRLVKRSDFLSGATIDYEVPRDEKNIALFAIASSGHLKFHYDAGKDQILINDASAKLDFTSPFSGSDQESVKFTGTGVRETSGTK